MKKKLHLCHLLSIMLLIAITFPDLVYGQVSFEDIKERYGERGLFLPTNAILGIYAQGHHKSDEIGLLEIYSIINTRGENSITKNVSMIYFDLNNLKAGTLRSTTMEGVYNPILWSDEEFKNNVVSVFKYLNGNQSMIAQKNRVTEILRNANQYDADTIISELTKLAEMSGEPYVNPILEYEIYFNLRNDISRALELNLPDELTSNLEKFNNDFVSEIQFHTDETLQISDINDENRLLYLNAEQFERLELLNRNVNQKLRNY